ncbi:hypothetical protein UFOVP244_104 [uncultured Caudovirales phage]|uniref:Uncharacterized protein n=1 Tax=uncultured Caudovirales phage TaxID=2100421 RepID=A0A6J7WWI3_9CAUD|nr:hypothetical protein UFOVP244_104 [uncultured Caudovirales phage]
MISRKESEMTKEKDPADVRKSRITSPEKPFRVAELAYRPWDEFPWYVVRSGAVSEQGGLRFGTEGVGFISIDDAVGYIKAATERDLSVIEDLIEKKRKSDVSHNDNEILG